MLKWRIVKFKAQCTVAELFVVICQQYLKVELDTMMVETAYVGMNKEALDLTDLDIDLG